MVLLMLFSCLNETLQLPLNILCSAAPFPVQARGNYMLLSYFPVKGYTFPCLQCSAVAFSAILCRIAWCNILFSASQVCFVYEKL